MLFAFRDALKSTDGEEYDPVLNADVPVKIRLLRSMIRASKLERTAQIIHNFDTAAIYLHHLLTDKPNAGKLPDLPDGCIGKDLDIREWW